MAALDLLVGDITTRALIAAGYGGATFGGIEPSVKSGCVFVFTDPQVGEGHGYSYDGWSPDEEGAFFYTGAGQEGNQELNNRGNKALLEHAAAGRDVHVFEVAGTQKVGGKLQRYLGAFDVDQSAPYRWEPATDRTGAMRQVLVFRLIAAKAHASREVSAAPVAVTPTITQVSSEVSTVDRYQVSGTDEREADRTEATMAAAFEEHLRALGHEPARARIRLPVGTQIVTDTWDVTAGVLYEAKAAATRGNVRLAVGQLLDYLRYFEQNRPRGAVLLPTFPGDDLTGLIHSVGFGLAWPDGDEWVHSWPSADPTSGLVGA